jgi:hypothetical protein
MVTVLEECTTEKQRSVRRFFLPKDSTQKIVIKKLLLFTVGSLTSISLVRQKHPDGKHFADDEEVEKEVWKWLGSSHKTSVLRVLTH